MIAAAADPNGPANMIATGLFWTVGILALVAVGKAFDWLSTRRIRRGISSALDSGDQHVLRAVTEREHSEREHVAVPRQLTTRSPR